MVVRIFARHLAVFDPATEIPPVDVLPNHYRRITPYLYTDLEITARLHDFIAAWPEGSSYLGFLFARAAGPAEVEDALRTAHRKLRFTLTPRLPVEHPLSHTVPPADCA